MGMENIDIANRGVDDRRETVAIYEAKLAAAEKQRATILIDKRKASAAADMGDQRARLALVGLNKQDAAVGRLVLSIEAQLDEARKWLAMAVDQAATAAAKRASVDAAAVLCDRLFEVETPDGRKVRHHHATADSLQKMLQPGYKVVAEVFGAGIDGNGGLVEPIGQSTMKTLLAAHGDELIAFLAERGIKSITA
jgi:hypothetical protein